jgi:hypothetical protein
MYTYVKYHQLDKKFLNDILGSGNYYD